MSLDKWERWHDGTLRNAESHGSLWITRVQVRKRDKPSWRVDGWRNERVPEHPEDKAEGWCRVEFTLGSFETLGAAKEMGEMYLRSRGRSGPRGTRADWEKVEADLRARIEKIVHESEAGFWDDVIEGHAPGFLEFGWSFFPASSDMERDLRELAEALLAVAESARKRLERERLIEKLEATDGRTPEEAALYTAKAAEMRARS